jgi:hypothetical protein
VKPLEKAIAIALFVCACKPTPTIEVEAPPAPKLSPEPPWKIERDGEAPVLASGRARIYASGARRGHGDRLPGLTIGDERGPKLGLLGGAYAPLLGPVDTDRSYQLTIDGALRVRLTDDKGALAFDAETKSSDAELGRIVVRGPFVVWLTADRTELVASYEGKPSFSTPIAAGDPPEVRSFRADRIDVDAKSHGQVTIETGCVRPRIVRPVSRGSTSVFGILLGPPVDPDPFYDVSKTRLPLAEAGCGSATSTVTFRWP